MDILHAGSLPSCGSLNDAGDEAKIELFRQTVATAFLRALDLKADQAAINFMDGNVDPQMGRLALMLLGAAAQDGLAVATMLRSIWPTHCPSEPSGHLLEARSEVAKPETSAPTGGVHISARNGPPLPVESVNLSVNSGPAAALTALQHSKQGAFQENGRLMSAMRFPANLTSREMQIVERIVAGESNKEIARSLDIGVATVKSHVHNLLRKIGLERRSKVLVWWYEFDRSEINREALTAEPIGGQGSGSSAVFTPG